MEVPEPPPLKPRKVNFVVATFCLNLKIAAAGGNTLRYMLASKKTILFELLSILVRELSLVENPHPRPPHHMLNAYKLRSFSVRLRASHAMQATKLLRRI